MANDDSIEMRLRSYANIVRPYYASFNWKEPAEPTPVPEAPTSLFSGIVRSSRVEIESLVGLRSIEGAHINADEPRSISVGIDGALYRFTEEWAPIDRLREQIDRVNEPREDFDRGWWQSLRPSKAYSRLGEVARHDCPFDVAAKALAVPLVCELRIYRERNARVLYAVDESRDLVVLAVGTVDVNSTTQSYLALWKPEGWTPKWYARAIGASTDEP